MSLVIDMMEACMDCTYGNSWPNVLLMNCGVFYNEYLPAMKASGQEFILDPKWNWKMQFNGCEIVKSTEVERFAFASKWPKEN